VKQAASAKTCLQEIGASLSDVLRIPSDGDQRSEVMAIAIPN
jgi:hypothetical protein